MAAGGGPITAKTRSTSLLYEVSAMDPATFGGAAILMTGVSLLATWLPARSASRVEPTRALRAE